MTASRGQSKYVDAKTLARISGLELRARMAVEGFFAGMHRSPWQGQSIEFAGHRSYVQGDDLRHVDWKLFGRTDKYYIKEYEQESNLTCFLVTDSSASMAYQSAEAVMSKWDYAASLAASFAYLALRQRDSVGLVSFDDAVQRFLKPSNSPGYWRVLIEELQRTPRGAKTRVGAVLNDLLERLPPRALIVVISDLFDDLESTLLALRRLRYNHHDVIVCHVWDPAELRFPFTQATCFLGLEESGRVRTDPAGIRSAYLEQVRRFTDRLSRGCRRMLVDYCPFDTGTALDVAISAYLASRSASVRRRRSRTLA